MNRALYAAASGMEAEQQHLDTVAANLASADITAFQGQVLQFAAQRANDGSILGVQTTGTRLHCAQGKIESSAGPCDLAIRGAGYFEVQRGHEIAYTRCGAFHRTATGALENTQGWQLKGINIPTDVRALHVQANGVVEICDAKNYTRALGTIRLANFDDPGALENIDEVTYRPTALSGQAHMRALRDDGDGEILFGHLERGNISIVDAMMEILEAQRAYEANAKGVQAADEMVRIANNIQRG